MQDPEKKKVPDTEEPDGKPKVSYLHFFLLLFCKTKIKPKMKKGETISVNATNSDLPSRSKTFKKYSLNFLKKNSNIGKR